MTSLYSHADFDKAPTLATETLGTLLREGCLSLFLGAGVSKGFGLPDWKTLIARVLDKESDASFMLSLAQLGEKELAKLLDPIDDESLSYSKRVADALYRDVPVDVTQQLQRSPLLLAIAALITGSCRGRITSVTTYNFDNLLEEYLSMLGYAVCQRTAPDQLSNRADVEVNHPHGLLKRGWDGTTKVERPVFSEKSYRSKRSSIDQGWSSGIEHALFSKIGLFIGLSGDDSSILDVLKRAHRQIQRSDDYCGYWLLTPDAYDRNGASILDVGMCPIRVDKDTLPTFVLQTCQNAAGASAGSC